MRSRLSTMRGALKARAMNRSILPSWPTLRRRPLASVGRPRTMQHRSITAHATTPKSSTEPLFLSDLIAFESDLEKSSSSSVEPEDTTAKVQEIIDRATKVLEAARHALGPDALSTDTPSAASAATPQAPAPSSAATALSAPPPTASPETSGTRSSVVGRVGAAAPRAPAAAGGASSGIPGVGAGVGAAGAPEQLTRRWSPLSEEQDLTRHVLQSALDEMQRSGAPLGNGNGSGSGSSSGSYGSSDAGASGGGYGSSSDGGSGAAAPSWAQSFLSAPDSPGASSDLTSSGGGLRLQAARASPMASPLALAELEPPPPPMGAMLFSASQSDQDRARARSAVLPPLQSIVELTSAFRPPERGAPAPAAEGAEPVMAGRSLADGAGALPDGSTWEKKSGVEYGQNGYWKRWHLLRGTANGGRVQWEETWWEASDYTGFKEMGAEKKGNDAAGGAWKETWTERLHYVGADLDCVVERSAHKWAHSAEGDEWEEKWGEYYHAGGKVDKWADKWGKQGPNVWHERWGEDYDGQGAVVKWTDKWAERLLPGGAREQWGDKWHEAFADGRGEKNGEVWSVDGGGHRYQRWWGEQHPGDGSVRRYGHSTGGEQWDQRVQMDTYYNPVPHFGYKLALEHSPQLKSVPLRPKEVNEEDPFGPGIDDL